MGGYEVFMHLSLLESVPKSGTQRRRVMDFVRSLRGRPDAPGDFTNKDRSLRIRQVKIIGDYAITYWVDSPVKVVMVVDVSLADK